MPVMKVGMVSDGWVKDADRVGGFSASQTPTANTIPVAMSTGKLDAGWLPAVGNLNQVQFTTSGTWVVPSGVTKIMVFAIAGGGGGGGSAANSGTSGVNGGTGGSTSVSGSVSGSLFSLDGGSGGSAGSIASDGTQYTGSTGANYLNIVYPSSWGISSPFGRGGIPTTSGAGGNGSGYGAGGAGGAVYTFGGGGGCGRFLIGQIFSVTPGETLTITIGAGGAGGAGAVGGYSGGAGSPGFVRIIYFA